MRIHLRLTAVVCALCLGTTAHALHRAPRSSPMPENARAKKLLDEGLAAYEEGDFAAAVQAFKRGYAVDDAPAFLYSWAQAERRRGNCRSAVELYNRFIQTDPGPEAAALAREAKGLCADALAAEVDAEEAQDVEIDDELFEDEIENESSTSVEPARDDAPTPDGGKAWYKDALGGTFVATGVVGVGVGIGLLAAASIEEGKRPADYGSFADQVQKIENLRIAGGVVLGVGGALLLGGVIRWAVLGNRQKRAAAVSLILDRQTAGLVLRGRF